ncbi:hypothetical protein Tco_0629728 [Tanacetum coccineum]|uniref:Uncharacterized protein n=1 Tax=Tanacetum coccineum TaxID=301880 RepID=A0ABQ4WTX7_9ASTR
MTMVKPFYPDAELAAAYQAAAKGEMPWVLYFVDLACFKELILSSVFSQSELKQERLKREYHSIPKGARRNSTELHAIVSYRLAGFLDRLLGMTMIGPNVQTRGTRVEGEFYNRVAKLKAHVMDVSGRLEGEFYPAYLTALAGQRWLLTHGIELAMVKCLKSPEYQGILGHALGRAVDYGMQEGLAAVHEHGSSGPTIFASSVKQILRLLRAYLSCAKPLADLPVAAHLQPCLEQLSVPIYHANVNSVVGETSLSFALLNVHARAEGAKKHAATLRQLMVDIVSHPLSSQNLLGEASTSVVISCVEDLDTDEDLGSVVSTIKEFDFTLDLSGKGQAMSIPLLINRPRRLDGGQVQLRIPWDGR